MWISNLNIIPAIKNPLAGATPPASGFVELEPNLFLVELEASTDLVELE